MKPPTDPRITRLVRVIRRRETEIAVLKQERVILAKLAAEIPQFYNPLRVAEAKQLRDRILNNPE